MSEPLNLVDVGREAESRAADFLIEQGYTIVTRRYKSSRGELDLVVLDGEIVVFVEVKHRRTPDHSPEDSLGRQKLDALRRAMAAYVDEMDLHHRETRLDLVAIDPEGLRHHKDVLAL